MLDRVRQKEQTMEHATVFPTLSYDEAQAAIDFLIEAFGAEQHAVYRGEDGTIQHAELRFGNGIVMLGSSTGEMPATRGRSGGIYIVVAEPDEHHARAREAGAEIVRELHNTEYGSRDYTAKDPEGNTWYFGTYQPFAYEHKTEQPNTATAD
jgi:uncharacterized glyoxalase superfamily protein PhnB